MPMAPNTNGSAAINPVWVSVAPNALMMVGRKKAHAVACRVETEVHQSAQQNARIGQRLPQGKDVQTALLVALFGGLHAPSIATSSEDFCNQPAWRGKSVR